MIEADRIIPGAIDRPNAAIRSGDSNNSHVDDMLDDLAELVVAKGGKVIIVPSERMPSDRGLAANYRF